MKGKGVYVFLLALCLMFFAALTGAQAQVILSENFEGGWGDWLANNGVWEIGTPVDGPKPAAHGGTQCAGTILDGFYPGDTDSRLRGPSLTLPSVAQGQEIHLRFWQWFSYAVRDAGYVQISVYQPATSTWSEFTTIARANPIFDQSSVWSPMDVDLTSFASKRIRIGFYHTADSRYYNECSWGWYIDDVQVVKKSSEFTGDFEQGWGDWSTDRGVWEIGVPTEGPSGCHSGTQCAGTVLAGNYPGDTDSRLVSPTIQLPSVKGYEELYLRFWHWFSYAVRDAGYVQISVYDPATSEWSDWTTIGDPVVNESPVWSYRGDYELTSYASRKVRIAFYHTGDSRYYGECSTGWYIDDVSITNVTPSPYGQYVDIASLPDMDSSGFPEVATLRIHPVTRVPSVEIRDSHSRSLIQKLSFFSAEFVPTALATVPDLDGNGFSELAVLGVSNTTGNLSVQIRDAKTKNRLITIPFLTLKHTSKGMTVVPDMNGNGYWELSVLGVNETTGAVTAQIRDAKTGDLLNSIPLPK